MKSMARAVFMYYNYIDGWTTSYVRHVSLKKEKNLEKCPIAGIRTGDLGVGSVSWRHLSYSY